MAESKTIKRGRRFKDLTGQRFGAIVVVEMAHRQIRPNGRGTKLYWRCVCDCGQTTVAESSNLTNGNTSTCGCSKYASRNATHGKSRTRMYAIWMHMKQRCHNPDNHAFADYGGRGITVCDEWRESFEKFAKDMGNPPSASHTLDRINNNLGYSKDNCHWATWNQQARNRRSTVIVEHNGESRSLNEWAEIVGIHRDRLYNRIFQCGWSVPRAFETPVNLFGHKRAPVARAHR